MPTTFELLIVFGLGNYIFAIFEIRVKKEAGHNPAYILFSDSTCNLSRTQTACANINRLRCAVNNSSNFSYIRFPGSVRSSVRVADFNSEGNALAADIAFSHTKHLQIILQSSKHIYFNIKIRNLQYLFR